MNYIKHYIKLTRRAFHSGRKRNDCIFYEGHHVKPNCLGGKRIVLLTPKEHYIAHFLLYKHFKKYGNKNSFIKMSRAFNAMTFSSDDNIKRYTSNTFSIARKAYAISVRGKNNPMYGQKRPEAAIKIGFGANNIANRPEVRDKLKQAWINKPLIQCPYCEISSKNKGNMTRHHFNNCKYKPIFE